MTLHFHNTMHLGDCLNSLHYLIKLHNITGEPYELACNPAYHPELSQMIPTNMQVRLTAEKSSTGYNLWGHSIMSRHTRNQQHQLVPMCHRKDSLLDLNMSVFITHQLVSQELGVPCPYQSVLDTLFDEPVFAQTDRVHSHIDVLIVNSLPLSGQIKYDEWQQDILMTKLAQLYHDHGKSIITTKKLHDLPCTRDYDLSLVEIGQLSKRCEQIIGFTTSPFWTCLNRYTFDKCQSFVTLTNDIATFDLDDRFETYYLSSSSIGFTSQPS